MAKYQEFYQKMLDDHSGLFKEFTEVHAAYHLDPSQWQTRFNEIGSEVLEVIREYESRLCSKSETGGYANYSSRLAEKFHYEIKKHFPKIDFIGITTNQTFVFKKLSFS